MARWFLFAEAIVLFVGLPLAYRVSPWRPPALPLLWLIAAYAWWLFRKPLAVTLCFFRGILFAWRYQQSGSLLYILPGAFLVRMLPVHRWPGSVCLPRDRTRAALTHKVLFTLTRPPPSLTQ